jgi:hypothetical protein
MNWRRLRRMTNAPPSDAASKATRGVWLRTLLLLAVLLAVVLETALRGMGAAPSGFNPGSTSTAGLLSSTGQHRTVGDQGEPEPAAAAKGKAHKKSEHKGNKNTKSKGDKQNKDKQKADKKAKHKGDKQGKHKGDGKGKHKGDKQGKHKGDKHKGDGKGKHKGR